MKKGKKGNSRAVAKAKKDNGLKTDGFYNVIAGMGSIRDKRVNTQWQNTTVENFDEKTLKNMYETDGMTKKIIDMLPDDMTKEPFTFVNDEDKILEISFARLKIEKIINKVFKWKRLYGGAFILIGAFDGGDFVNPLNEIDFDIEYLRVFNQNSIDENRTILQEDPTQKNFGQIEVYAIKIPKKDSIAPVVMVHHSRVIEVKGFIIDEKAGVEKGLSIINSVYQQISDLNGAFNAIQNIMMEFIIGKFKMNGLAEKLSMGQEKDIINRMDIIGMSKSVINAVLLDDTEDYIRDSANVGGLSDLIDRIMMNLSAVTGYPLTKLFGRSPSGQNATGYSDMNNYYDVVRAEQRNEMMPVLNRLTELIINGEGTVIADKTEIPHIELKALDAPSEKEQAEIDKLKAETQKTYVDSLNVMYGTSLFTGEQMEEAAKEWGIINGE